MVALAIWIAACGRGDPEVTPDATTPAPPSEPTLAEVAVTELTPLPLRRDELSAALGSKVTNALHRTFKESKDDPRACRALVGVAYALVVNGRPVATADAGEAHAMFEGEVYCPDPATGKPQEGYRFETTARLPFGGEHGGDGAGRLAEAVDEVAREGADALYGQVKIRHVDDLALRAALATSDHPGVLAEAASEAGERRLSDVGPRLVELTRHPNRRVATRAGAALGLLRLDTPEVIRALVALTEGPDSEKHLVAVHALGDIGSTEARRYLDMIALGHPTPAIRSLARERLGRPQESPPSEPVPDPTP